jgi:NAD(P)H dehydrogenase (quinone)
MVGLAAKRTIVGVCAAIKQNSLAGNRNETTVITGGKMNAKIYVIFYSMYGHVYRLAEAVAEGARSVKNTDIRLYQVPELMTDAALEAAGAKAARKVFAHIPVANPAQLAEADALIFGTPTRFGNMCAQMRNFLDQTGGLWMKGALVGKVGSVFASTATQHGGQETTICSFHSTLLHHGMILVGVPYSEQRLLTMAEISGGTPYGATTLAGADGARMPSANELAIAKFQGQHVAEIAVKLSR